MNAAILMGLCLIAGCLAYYPQVSPYRPLPMYPGMMNPAYGFNPFRMSHGYKRSPNVVYGSRSNDFDDVHMDDMGMGDMGMGVNFGGLGMGMGNMGLGNMGLGNMGMDMGNMGIGIDLLGPGFFHKLGNLGNDIRQSIGKAMAPMQVKMAQSAMSVGTGGVTLVTITETGRQFLMLEGEAFICYGHIMPNYAGIPECRGHLISAHNNICIPGQNYVQYNNIRCVGRDTSLVNGQCVRGIRVTIADLMRTCGQRFGTDMYASYQYFPSDHNPGAVRIIGNKACQNDPQMGYCAWQGA